MTKISEFPIIASASETQDYFILTKDNGNGTFTDERILKANVKLTPYKSYLATVSQSGTSDPIAIIIYNDLDEIPIWTYGAFGQYTLTSSGIFTIGKTALFIGGNDNRGIHVLTPITKYIMQNDQFSILLTTGDLNGNYSDDILLDQFIEIRIYN